MNLSKLPDLVGNKGIFIDGDWVESKDQDAAGDVRLIQLADIGIGEYLNKSARFMTSQKAAELKCTYLLPGDILIARMPDPIGRACIFPGDSKPCVTVVDVCILRISPEIADPNWVLHYLNSAIFQRKISPWVKGATRQRISRGNLGGIEFKLPSLAEQKRIAAILDKADAIRRKRQQAIQLADEFLRSVFLEMFGKLLHSPKDSWKELGNETDFIDYRGKSPPKSSSGIPLITARNVRDGYLTDEPREYIAEEEYYSWMTRGFLKEYDILFTTEAPLGNVALLGKYDKVALGQRVIAIRPNKKLKPEFMLYALRHPIIRGDIDARSTGSTAKGIRSQELSKISIPIPKDTDQNKFASIYWKADALKIVSEKEYQDAETLFNSLSQRAFRGDL